MAEGVGFEPTEGYKPPPVFKTGAFSQLDHPSVSRLSLLSLECGAAFVKWDS